MQLCLVENYHTNYLLDKTYFSIIFMEHWIHIMSDTHFQVLWM